ncbi:hypothetical protein JCM5350_004801, partial [Sporobolomyces pararoseus]
MQDQDQGRSESPPLAYPVVPSSSFFDSPPLSRSSSSSNNPWARSGTFLLSGSAAPPIVNTRRPPPFRGHSSTPSSPPTNSPSPSRLTNAKTEVPTEAHIAELVQKFSQSQSSGFGEKPQETDEQLAQRLHQIEISGIQPESVLNVNGIAEKEEEALSSYIVSAFSSLETLDQSFSPTTSESDTPHPTTATVQSFYHLLKQRPDQVDLLRTLADLSTNSLLSSCKVSTRAVKNGESCTLDLLANSPSTQHHLLVSYLASPSYPSHLLLSHIQLLISHISYLVLSSSTPPSERWQIHACAKLASLFLAARNNSEFHRRWINLSEFYVTAIDALGEEEWIEDFLEWESTTQEFEKGDDQVPLTFRFRQYPFLLSLGIKKRLLDFENQRQIMDEAAAAIRSNLTSYRDFEGFWEE